MYARAKLPLTQDPATILHTYIHRYIHTYIHKHRRGTTQSSRGTPTCHFWPSSEMTRMRRTKGTKAVQSRSRTRLHIATINMQVCWRVFMHDLIHIHVHGRIYVCMYLFMRIFIDKRRYAFCISIRTYTNSHQPWHTYDQGSLITSTISMSMCMCMGAMVKEWRQWIAVGTQMAARMWRESA
jgi:hypothetical protein